MPRYKLPDNMQRHKSVSKLEARLKALNKVISALPPLCECETKYSSGEKSALAEKLVGLWQRDFEQELKTGVRASMDDMDPSK